MKQKLFIFLCLCTLCIGSTWGGGVDFAPENTILWGENFAHFGTKTPSAAGTGTGTTIYGNATITYSQTSSNTKGYNEKLAGGTAPELLLSKSNVTWTISGIKTGGAKVISLTFLSNKTTFSLTCSTKLYTVGGSEKSWTLNLIDGDTAPETINLTLKNTGGDNARIDDVVLKVTEAGEGATPAAELTSIAISGNPTKTTYEAGESFDPAGLTVMGTYEGQTDPEEITSGITWTFAPDPLTTGTTSVSVTATVDEIESEPFEVTGLTVNEFVQTYANTYTSDASLSSVITGSKVKWEGCKETDGYAALKIAKAETASITVPAGTKTVHLHMVAWNGESADVAVKLGETSLSSIKPTADTGVSGNSTTYTIATEPKTENSYYFAIEVNADEETTLSLTTGSNKRAILFGVNFEADTKPLLSADVEEIVFDQKELSGTVTDSKVISATGMNLTAAISASMKEGSNAIFSVTPVGAPTATAGEFTVSYSTTEAGEYNGTVVLSSGETSLEIPVSASVVAHIPVLQSIYVKGEPTKKEYTVGDAFETDGLEVWGKYDEGADKQITENIEWAVTPATFSATTETSVSVVATALEKTSEAFAVTGLTIKAAPQIATYDFTTNLYGHTGVSSSSSTAGDIAVDEIFSESPTQIKFIKSGSTATRFWDANEKHELRLYTNSEFNISAEGYNITKVEFDGSAANFTVDDVAIKNKIWSGKNKTVTFKTTATSNINKIMVYYAVADPSAATPTITPSAEAETYWEPITITLASTTEGAAIYYTTNGDAPTAESNLYSEPIAVSATTTIKAIAIKDGLDNSEIATKTFNFGLIYNSLADLVAAEIVSGTIVKVSFENAKITGLYINKDGKHHGVYLNTQKDGNDIEIYCNTEEHSEEWAVNGELSGTLVGVWKEFNGTWEICPDNWNGLTYTAPKEISSIEISGTATKTVYTEGEKFNDYSGLTVTATYTDQTTEDVTGMVEWSVDPSDALTTDITFVTVTAKINEVSDDAVINITVNPEPAHITWDLTKASYDAEPTDDYISWSSVVATMTNVKVSGSTKVTNYIPTAQSSTRFYNGHKLTITPVIGKSISSIVFEAKSNSYAKAFKGSTWTNATASMEEGTEAKTVTITPTKGKIAVSATIGGTCGFEKVTVYYDEYEVSANMAITAAKWGTFCAPFAVTIPDGVKAYTADASGSNVAFTEVTTTIPAGTPVVVYSEEVVNQNFAGAATVNTNDCTYGVLKGVYTATSGITAEAGYTNYVLQNNTQGVGFYKVAEGSTISLKANRCYMTIPTTSAAKEGFTFEEIITGINEILNPTKKSAEGIFDLNGRKLAAPQKGINIINGVKVIVK